MTPECHLAAVNRNGPPRLLVTLPSNVRGSAMDDDVAEALAEIEAHVRRTEIKREANWQEAVRRSKKFVGKYEPILYGEGEQDYEGCLYDDATEA